MNVSFSTKTSSVTMANVVIAMDHNIFSVKQLVVKSGAVSCRLCLSQMLLLLSWNHICPRLKSSEWPAASDLVICSIISVWPKNAQTKSTTVVVVGRLCLQIWSWDLLNPTSCLYSFFLPKADSCTEIWLWVVSALWWQFFILHCMNDVISNYWAVCLLLISLAPWAPCQCCHLRILHLLLQDKK